MDPRSLPRLSESADEAVSDATLRPHLRADLEFHRRTIDGRTVVFVKDPLRAYLVGLTELQALVARRMDGRRSASELAEALEEELEAEIPTAMTERIATVFRDRLLLDVTAYDEPPRKIARAIAAATRTIVHEGAERDPERWNDVQAELARDRPIAAAKALDRARRNATPKEDAKLAAARGAIHTAFFRAHRTVADHMTMIHLWNPDRFLGWLDRRVGKFVFGTGGLLAAMVLLLSTIPALINIEPPALGDLRWTDLLLLRTVIFVPEYFVHEVLGHGLACKHYGGKVDDVGVMLFYGVVPGAYTDVTDVHLFERPRNKVVVYLAGILAELPMLALWCHVYYLTDRHFFLHNAIFLWLVYSLYLIAKNLIPTVVGFDGYYALAHGLGMPDLAPDANAYLTALLAAKATRRPLADALRNKPARERRILVAFGLASALTFGLFAIVVVFYVLSLAFDYGRGLGLFFASAYAYHAIGKRLVRPLVRAVRFGWRERAAIFGRTRIVALIGMTAAVVALLSIRWPLLVDGDVVVKPVARATLFAEEPGIVESVPVVEGEAVHAGDVVVVMRNEALSRERAVLAALLEREEARTAALRVGARPEELTLAFARATYGDVAADHARREATRSAALVRIGTESATRAAALERDAVRLAGDTAKAREELALVRHATRAEDLAAAEAYLRELALRLAVLDDRLARLRVRSPIDGVVVGHLVREIERRSLERGAAIFEVHDLRRVYAEIAFPRGEPASAVHAGAPVEFRAYARSETPLRTTIGALRPKANEASALLVDTAATDNPGLVTGMTGHARIHGAPRSLAYQAFVVPFLPILEVDAWAFFKN